MLLCLPEVAILSLAASVSQPKRSSRCSWRIIKCSQHARWAITGGWKEGAALFALIGIGQIDALFFVGCPAKNQMPTWSPSRPSLTSTHPDRQARAIQEPWKKSETGGGQRNAQGPQKSCVAGRTRSCCLQPLLHRGHYDRLIAFALLLVDNRKIEAKGRKRRERGRRKSPFPFPSL